MSDKLKIPEEYRLKVERVEKYCTKPELEMLFILAEGRFGDYDKVKSTSKPKQYAKTHIRCGRKAYNNATQFYRDYFHNNIDLLVHAIREYKRLKGRSHRSDELCLADLLRNP